MHRLCPCLRFLQCSRLLATTFNVSNAGNTPASPHVLDDAVPAVGLLLSATPLLRILPKSGQRPFRNPELSCEAYQLDPEVRAGRGDGRRARGRCWVGGSASLGYVERSVGLRFHFQGRTPISRSKIGQDSIWLCWHGVA